MCKALLYSKTVLIQGTGGKNPSFEVCNISVVRFFTVDLSVVSDSSNSVIV